MKTALTMVLALILGWSEVALACRARTPLEALFGAWFKGPSFIKTSSDAAQFAGRTTLESGSP